MTTPSAMTSSAWAGGQDKRYRYLTSTRSSYFLRSDTGTSDDRITYC